MNMALLTGARPQMASDGPVVALRKGNWKIVCEGLVNSVLVLHHDGLAQQCQHGLIFDGPTIVQVKFLTRGNEPYISVSAELQHGLEP